MFLPFGDEPNAPQTPVMTYGLIALNVCVWLFVAAPLAGRPVDPGHPQLGAYLHSVGLDLYSARFLPRVSAYDVWLFEHAFCPARLSLLTLMTSLFLHAGWPHLLGNMLFLYIFGDNVEAQLGRFGFLAVYLATGVVGTLCYTLLRLHSQLPLIGASGAISGILGCYFVWFAHNRVRVLVFFFLFVDIILVPARFVLGFYLIVENILPLLTQNVATGGVAYGAHLGGFAAGAAFAEIWRRYTVPAVIRAFYRQSLWRGFFRRLDGGGVPHPPPAPPKLPDASHPEAFGTLVLQAQWQQAAALEANMLRVERARQRPETLFILADGLTQEQHYTAALALLQRLIVLYVAAEQSELLARAQLRAGLILWRGLQRPEAARPYLLRVLHLLADARLHAAARRALADIDASAPGTDV